MSSERRAVRCSCGNPKLKTRPRYGIGKWFLLVFGGTPVPDGKEVYCDRCDQVVASTTA
jgi:hypothetical protein